MKLIVLFLVAGSAVGFRLWEEHTVKPAVPADTYVVNLDLDPKERYFLRSGS